MPAAHRAQARAFDLEDTVQRLVEDAKGGDIIAIGETVSVLHELSRGVRVEGSADLGDVLLFMQAHRALVHEAAKRGDTWVPVAFAASNEVGRTFETLVRATMAMRPDAGTYRQVGFQDLVVVLDEAADAMLDRFPTPPPAVVAKDPDWTHPEAGFRFVALYGTLGLYVSRCVRTDADVATFLGALDRMLAKAKGSPDVPKSLVTKLAAWAEDYRALRPKGPRAVAEAQLTLR